MQRPRLLVLLLFACLGAGCANGPAPLTALDRPVDLERFMGAWYVVAHIPIDLPFASEAEAYAAVETYTLRDDGEIDIEYDFLDGGFDGPPTRFRQRGWVHDPVHRSEWRVQAVWPFRAAYLITWVDPEYQRALIGVPSRSYAWILAREPVLSEEEIDRLSQRVADLGYDRALLRRVPQRDAADDATSASP